MYNAQPIPVKLGVLYPEQIYRKNANNFHLKCLLQPPHVQPKVRFSCVSGLRSIIFQYATQNVNT